jgi:hypothetical protein
MKILSLGTGYGGAAGQRLAHFLLLAGVAYRVQDRVQGVRTNH